MSDTPAITDFHSANLGLWGQTPGFQQEIAQAPDIFTDPTTGQLMRRGYEIPSGGDSPGQQIPNTPIGVVGPDQMENYIIGGQFKSLGRPMAPSRDEGIGKWLAPMLKMASFATGANALAGSSLFSGAAAASPWEAELAGAALPTGEAAAATSSGNIFSKIGDWASNLFSPSGGTAAGATSGPVGVTDAALFAGPAAEGGFSEGLGYGGMLASAGGAGSVASGGGGIEGLLKGLLPSTAAGWAKAGLGGYQLYQSQQLKKMAETYLEKADPMAKYRAGYAEKLAALMANPSSITSVPGYQAGLEAVRASGAGQGWTSGGNMMVALNKYGGDFYNQEASRLAQLAGAQFNPATSASMGISAGLGTAGYENEAWKNILLSGQIGNKVLP